MSAAIRVTLFGGIIPRLADRGLPDNAAQFALNAKLYSGELRSWNELRALATSQQAPGATRKVYHYRYNDFDRYLTFDTDADVVKAPLLNEQLGRLYYTKEPGGAYVTTGDRLELGQAAFPLGVPAPVGNFAVVPTGGTPATAETRIYTTIFVSSFGEEGAPNPTVTASGNADGTWTINGLNTLTVPAGGWNVAKLRLYRTITTSSGVDYRMVNEWPMASRPASYVDNITAVDLADNPVLQSLGWDVAPAGLLGLVGVAGGYMAGFKGRTVYLSVPYQPHAWPVDFQYAVEDDIVGLGTFGNTITILTEGRPYLLVGPSPDAMSLQKMESVQPCLAKRSIVNTVAGVMYASTDGLVLIDGTANSGAIVSRNWVTKDEWLAQFTPRSILASVYQDRYFAFYTDELGFTVGFDDPVTGWTQLQQQDVLSVDLDTLTGQTMVTVAAPDTNPGPDIITEWDSDVNQQLTYVWKTKPFLQNKPCNFGAIQLRGSFIGNSGGIPLPPPQGVGGYSMNSQAIGGGKRPVFGLPQDNVPEYGGSINGPPPWLAQGISPFGVSANPLATPDPTAIVVKVYGDGVLRWFGEINSERPYRLPSGYKATLWEVEVQGVSPLFSMTLSDTVKNLENLP